MDSRSTGIVRRAAAFLVTATSVLLLLSPGARAGDPPPGPPWHMDYWSAKREALRQGQPVFIYFTKTY